jgi:hypothetical protein
VEYIKTVGLFALTTAVVFLFVQAGFPWAFATGFVVVFFIAGSIAGGYAQKEERRITSEMQHLEGEQLLEHGVAAQYPKAIGGWLYLTDQRVLFRPSAQNLLGKEISLPLRSIVEVDVFWFPQGLRITKAQGREYFGVRNRRKWIEEIRRAKDQLSAS